MLIVDEIPFGCTLKAGKTQPALGIIGEIFSEEHSSGITIKTLYSFLANSSAMVDFPTRRAPLINIAV
ncbi:MAG: hypothetical protein K2O56_06320, partial [Muribaculaceae bacterium]|nr:hypothetical protein [Muribaculaceae bacterium]